MERDEKETLFQYGKLVCDFANSKTADDILTSFFENIQFAFHFSSDFKENALKQFSTMKMTVGSLSIEQKDLFEKLLKRNRFLNSLNRAFATIDGHIEYDPKKLTFTIIKKEVNDYEEIIDKSYSIWQEAIEEYIKLSPIDDDRKSYVIDDANKLTELCQDIKDIKKKKGMRFEEINELADVYPDLTKMQSYLMKTQKNLKIILLKIIKSHRAYESEGFKSILKTYNTMEKTRIIVNEKNKLVESDAFNEKYFLNNDSRLNYEKIFNAPISYCLIQFLKNPEYRGQEKISVCKDCGLIFNKVKVNDRQKYCTNCAYKNHTPKDIQNKRTAASREFSKKRKIKEKRKALFETQFNKLINQGYTKEKAKELANLHVIEQVPVID